MVRAGLVLAALCALASPGAADDSGRVVRVIHNPPGDAPILGPRYAAVTMELFFTVDNHAASTAYRLLKQLARRHPLRLRIVYRPLVYSVDGTGANTMAIEAYRQGLFHEFLAAYYKNGSPRRGALDKVAEEVGIDWQRYVDARQRRTHVEALAANAARASRFSLQRSSAALLVNGEPINRVPSNIDHLEILYDTAYARARQILDLGYPVSEIYQRILRSRVADAVIPRIKVGQIDGRVRRRPKRNALPLANPLDYSGPYSTGPIDAPVVIVSFCRFASRVCRDQFHAINQTRAAFEGKVRHVFKPLYDPVEDPHERRIHLAAECAADQGAFWEYLGQAFNYNIRLRSDESKIRQAFANLNLDDKQFDECFDDERHGDKIDAQLGEASRVGVAYSPSTIIGGRIYIGKISAANLMRLVELELAPGLLGGWLESAGSPDRDTSR